MTPGNATVQDLLDPDSRNFEQKKQPRQERQEYQEQEQILSLPEHSSLKYSLLGPSLTKSGQDSVDQAKVRTLRT